MFDLFVWKLKRRKLRALKEVCLDLSYLESVHGDLLASNEDAIKKELTTENTKAKPDDKKVDRLIKKLAKFYSVKKQHEQSTELKNDLEAYIKHLG